MLLPTLPDHMNKCCKQTKELKGFIIMHAAAAVAEDGTAFFQVGFGTIRHLLNSVL